MTNLTEHISIIVGKRVLLAKEQKLLKIDGKRVGE